MTSKLSRWEKLAAEVVGYADGFRGCALMEQGKLEQGLNLMRNAASTWQGLWGAWRFPLDSLLAEVLGRQGQINDALELLSQTFETAQEGGAHWWDAELYRVRGEILFHGGEGNWPEVESCYGKAIEIARSRHARCLELRAAMSLARLWLARDEPKQARKTLAAVFEWFTEGFETADLKDAKALLNGA